MIALALKVVGFVGKIPPWAWKVLAILVLCALCFWYAAERVRKTYENAPADTTVNERTVHLQMAVTKLQLQLADADADLDTKDDSIRILKSTVLSKSWSADFYRKLAQRVQDLPTGRQDTTYHFEAPVATLDEDVFTFWNGRYYTDHIYAEYHYPPVNEFRRISVNLQDRIAETTYVVRDTTITRHITLPRPFAELFLGFGVNGRWDAPFLELETKTAWLNPGVQINIGNFELDVVPIGAFFDDRPHTIHSLSGKVKLN